MVTFLRSIGETEWNIHSIVYKFLGKERNGIRKNGLIHEESEEEFDKKYEILKPLLPQQFVEYLNDTRARQRPLIECMKNCMLKPVTVMAGLGNPPNAWDNNLVESMHGVMKDSLKNQRLDAGKFLEILKDRVFDQQLEELKRGIYGMGEYRLSDSYSKYGVTPIQ